MKVFLKSKCFIISTVCIITVITGITLSINNRCNNDDTVIISEADVDLINLKDSRNINDIEQKQYYGINQSQACWVADPKEPMNLFKFAKDTSIVKVKVKSIGQAKFFEKTKDFSAPYPFTPVEVIVEETLEGESLKDVQTIYLSGGDVKISEEMKALEPGTIEKRGYGILTKEQQETMYISYKSEYDYNLIPDEEYALIVAKQFNNSYVIVANGYGIFKEDNNSKKVTLDSAEKTFNNVLTERELTDGSGMVLKVK